MSDHQFKINSSDYKEGVLTPDSWRLKLEHRSGNRMKVVFKLSKEETEAFTVFKNQIKPENLDESSFVKSIFFLGLTTLETNVAQKIAEEMKSQVEDEEVSVPEEDAPEADE